MKNCNSARRTFLQQSALTTALALFPDLLRAEGLSLKPMATPTFNADVELAFSTQQAYVGILAGGNTEVQKIVGRLIKGPQNTLQQLPGNYLGPILRLHQGQKVRIFFSNQLSEASIIHWHGLHVPQISDGHPMYTIKTDEQFVYEFEVKNRAGTSFYHSHAHGLTAEQVYRGLAGLIIVHDQEESKLDLPSAEYDIPLVIQDRSFTAKNQLQYIKRMPERVMGFLGDTILVNGKPNAEFSVKTRAYRFRAVNGSNSRIYKLGWDDGTPLVAIASDAGLLAQPETKPYIMLAPGERVDLWLDFSGRAIGSKLTLFSLPYSGVMPAMYERMHQGGGGMGMGMMAAHLPQGSQFTIARFNVTEKVSDTPKLPVKLVNVPRLSLDVVANAQQPLSIAMAMHGMKPTLNGKTFAMDKVLDSEKVALGSYQYIRIFHDHSSDHQQGGMGMGMMGRRQQTEADDDKSHGMGMGMGMGMGGGMSGMMDMAHPIHLHGQQFQILRRLTDKVNQAAYQTVKQGFIDSGWKDTVLVMPGEEVQIIKPFHDYKGAFLYHCHNLEHEDLGMMRQYLVE